MRKKWTVLLLVLLVSAALVLPAAAAKGGKPEKPAPPAGLGVTVNLVDVTNGAWMFSVVAPGDLVVFRVEVTNMGQVPAEDVVVTDGWGIEFACADSEWADAPLACDSPLDPGATYYYQGTYTAVEGNLPASAEEKPKTNRDTVIATAEGASGSASVELTGYFAPPCAGNLASGSLVTPGVCRWEPNAYGFYSIVLTPNWGPRPINGAVTLRDHVGGNWCAVPDGYGGFIPGTGAMSFRRMQSGSLELRVYLPTNGVCLSGGAGGETLGVGNTHHFYLAPGPAGTVDAVTRCDPTVQGTWCEGLPVL